MNQFTTSQIPDTQAPVILSGPTITGRTSSSVTIQWTTNELSTSVVNYGTNNTINQQQEDGTLVTTHSVTLTNLSAATVYSYRVSSVDPSGNGPSQSAQAVVQTTASADVTPPVITAGPSASTVFVSSADGASATITWTTNEPADSKVEFGTTAALGQTKAVSEAVTVHTMTLTRWTPGTTYNYRVSSTDQSGNGPTFSGIVSVTAANTIDTTPPTLSGVSTTGTTTARLTVSWTTNEPSTSTLRALKIGTTDTVRVGSASLVTLHTLSITDTSRVKPNTAYTLLLESVDASGNTGSTSTTVTTPAAPDVTPPAVPAAVTATAGSEQVLVHWNAVAAADLAGYDVLQNGTPVATGVTDTTYNATGLANGTPYTYAIKSVDLTGNRSSVSPAVSATPSAAQAPSAPAPLGTYIGGVASDVVSVKPILVVNNATPVSGRPTPTYTFAVYGDSLLTTLVASVSGIPQGTSGNPTHWQLLNPSLPESVAVLDSTRYYWRARANDTVTDGPWSTAATFFTSRATRPTTIELASFTAEDHQGRVTLTWRTVQEAGLLGFDVYRGLRAEGPFERVTPSLLTGRQGQYQFQDRAVTVTVSYAYQVEAVSLDGMRQRFGPLVVRVTPPPTYSLGQNYPNPFNPTTTIRYELPRPGAVTLKVYNLLGQEVTTLVEAHQEAGFQSIEWHGLNTAHQRVASGVYFYRITVQGANKTEFTSAKKMLLLK